MSARHLRTLPNQPVVPPRTGLLELLFPKEGKSTDSATQGRLSHLVRLPVAYCATLACLSYAASSRNANCHPAACRRRKIRCVLTIGDVKQPCVNCTRLSKTCLFCPPDQPDNAMDQLRSAQELDPMFDTPALNPPTSYSEPFLCGSFYESKQSNTSRPLPLASPHFAQKLPPGPGALLPEQSVHGAPDFVMGPTLAFGTQQSPADGHATRGRPNDSFLPFETVDTAYGHSHHDPLLEFDLPVERFAEVPSIDGTILPPLLLDISITCPSSLSPFGQMHPPTLQPRVAVPHPSLGTPLEFASPSPPKATLHSRAAYRPEARDAIIMLPYEIEKVYEVVSETSGDLSLKWPSSPGDLIEVDPDTGVSHQSQALERCALNLHNWALHPTVISRYPVLVGRVRERAV